MQSAKLVTIFHYLALLVNFVKHRLHFFKLIRLRVDFLIIIRFFRYFIIFITKVIKISFKFVNFITLNHLFLNQRPILVNYWHLLITIFGHLGILLIHHGRVIVIS
jgi:hypothetical protein